MRQLCCSRNVNYPAAAAGVATARRACRRRSLEFVASCGSVWVSLVATVFSGISYVCVLASCASCVQARSNGGWVDVVDNTAGQCLALVEEWYACKIPQARAARAILVAMCSAAGTL